MPKLNKEQLVNTFVSAVESAGWSVGVVELRHPFRLYVYRDDEAYSVLLYIWNITPGGRNRPDRPARNRQSFRGYFSYRLNKRAAFVPPKPKLFESA